MDSTSRGHVQDTTGGDDHFAFSHPCWRVRVGGRMVKDESDPCFKWKIGKLSAHSFLSLVCKDGSSGCFLPHHSSRRNRPQCFVSIPPRTYNHITSAAFASSAGLRINHLLAHFSGIVARMLQNLTKERSGGCKASELVALF